MFKLHNIPHMQDAHVLAKSNVPRLVALYSSLVCKVTPQKATKKT